MVIFHESSTETCVIQSRMLEFNDIFLHNTLATEQRPMFCSESCATQTQHGGRVFSSSHFHKCGEEHYLQARYTDLYHGCCFKRQEIEMYEYTFPSRVTPIHVRAGLIHRERPSVSTIAYDGILMWCRTFLIRQYRDVYDRLRLIRGRTPNACVVRAF